MKVFMVEDSDKEAAFLQGLLDKCAVPITLLGRAHCIADGRVQLDQLDPDLVLLDVELPDGTGFDLLEFMRDRDFLVVFITGHDHYAIRALRYAAFDYLQKPVLALELEDMLRTVQRFQRRKLQGQLEVLSSVGGTPRLGMPSNNGVSIVDVDDILYIRSDGSYCHFHFKDGTRTVVSRVLKDYEFLADDHAFVRCHRSYLVHLDAVAEFEGRHGDPVLLHVGAEIPVSRSRMEEVAAALRDRKQHRR